MFIRSSNSIENMHLITRSSEAHHWKERLPIHLDQMNRNINCVLLTCANVLSCDLSVNRVIDLFFPLLILYQVKFLVCIESEVSFSTIFFRRMTAVHNTVCRKEVGKVVKFIVVFFLGEV